MLTVIYAVLLYCSAHFLVHVNIYVFCSHLRMCACDVGCSDGHLEGDVWKKDSCVSCICQV